MPSDGERRRLTPRSSAAVAAAVGAALTLAACGSSQPRGSAWPVPNHDLSSTRAAPGGGIDRASVARLRPVWRHRILTPPGDSGSVTATPIVAGGVVYLQDMRSNVVALDLATGAVRWRHRFGDRNPGPDGLAVAGGRVYGATDTNAFALSARTGRLLWSRFLITPTEQFVDIAPLVANGLVYVSTVGFLPGGKGALYALDAATGRVRWRFETIKGEWRYPQEAFGGGAWYPPSLAGGTLYWGTANPYPYGGTRAHPNGGAYAGPALYTDTLLALDARTGALRWYDQVTPHDVRDYDFALPPVVGEAGSRPAVFGAGKAGRVIAWDRGTRKRLWQVEVGVHLNDRGPLPARMVRVCPGIFGGVETPMALAGGTLFVPVVDLCMRGSRYGYASLERIDFAAGRGELVALDAATGRRRWTHRFDSPLFGCATVAGGVVFAPAYDGTVYGLDTRDGRLLWHATLGAGVNACPSIAGGRLLVAAGVARPDARTAELVAFAPSAS